jgi:predicted metal-dependent hydrolase
VVKEPDSSLQSVTVRGIQVPVLLRKSKRARRCKLKITTAHKVEVVLPTHVPLAAGEHFLNSKLHWLEKNIALLTPRESKYYLNGLEYRLEHLRLPELTRHAASHDYPNLRIESPAESTATPESLFAQYAKFLAKQHLPPLCEHLAAKHNFEPKKIRISNSKTRWGSCTSRGTISLNYRLIHLPDELTEYIILHELCHLRHPNHSKEFWREVSIIIPHYRELEKELKTQRFH